MISYLETHLKNDFITTDSFEPFLRGILGLPSDEFWAWWATLGVHFVRSVAHWGLARGHVRPTGRGRNLFWVALEV